jgi:hypothetical protein
MLAARLPRAGILVRVGPEGCLLSLRVAARDTCRGSPSMRGISTGGGHAHRLFTLRPGTGAGLAEAVRRANAAAALSVTRRGPATGPTAAELAAFLSAGG